VGRVSREKALAVERTPEDVVIAADTIVVLGDRILGKPADEAQAEEMLRALSGRDHQVMTGVTVLRGDRCLTATEITDIHFRDLTDREIEAYIRTGEPMDKAGAYGIQGKGGALVSSFDGRFDTIVGLSVSLTKRLIEEVTK
jgi:septum formation protein